jgi:hydrogenase expression/formation protein HypE
MRSGLQGFCEILGLDPLYLANERVLIAMVPDDEAQAALSAMRAHPSGHDAQLIGHVVPDRRGIVTLNTTFGGTRIVDMLIGEQLPRIC